MSIHDRGLVAITGANGTIGYACVVYALQTGFRVRCVVRHEDTIAYIKSGPSVQQFLDRITFAIVRNNTADGAYDSAIAGVDYVVHTAGSWPLPHLHPDNDIYWPFIKSTKGLIEAAQKIKSIKRIVFTQAGAGLADSEVGDTYGNLMETILDEHVRVNEASLLYRPPLASPHNAYCASKAQCMSYLNNLRLNKILPFDIAQVIPGTVIGPSEFVKTSSQALAHMDRQTKALIFDDMKPRYAFGFVHVQDCAKIHIEALDEKNIKSEDIPPWFVAAGTIAEGVNGDTLWSSAVDMVERTFPEAIQSNTFKLGKTKSPINMPYRANSRATEKMLLQGKPIRGLEESVKEVIQWYLNLKREED
ncbi:hypothetical protein ACN47E_007565 [Coniothyrium glycines]